MSQLLVPQNKNCDNDCHQFVFHTILYIWGYQFREDYVTCHGLTYTKFWYFKVGYLISKSKFFLTLQEAAKSQSILLIREYSEYVVSHIYTQIKIEKNNMLLTHWLN